jgi:hypothetical protein
MTIVAIGHGERTLSRLRAVWFLGKTIGRLLDRTQIQALRRFAGERQRRRNDIRLAVT